MIQSQTVALDDLAQRISELETLKREYQARQAKLPALQRRERRLEKQLQKVRGQIEALTKGTGPRAVTEPRSSSNGKPSSAKAPASNLTDLIVEIVRDAGRAIKVQALAEEVASRDFPTTSKNVENLVKSKVGQLVMRGVLRRAGRRRGVMLGKSKNKPQAAAVKKANAAGKHSQNGAASAKAPKSAPATRNGQQSLQSVLTDILSKSRKPLTAQELADQARAAGYRTKSGDFKNVIWVTLRKMGAEKVPDKGFRLKPVSAQD